jgi:hypothetical protein
MNYSLTGSIITNGGINVAKNIYAQNFQTNNGSDINNIISQISAGANRYMVNLYLSYNLSYIKTIVTSSKFYSMQCNSEFNGYVNVLTPLELQLRASYTGTVLSAFTFSIAVTDLNLVIYKNGSYLTYVPFLMTDTNLYNFTYHGTVAGVQSYIVNIFMSSVSTTFYVDDATNNSTVTYDFYVQATMTYNAIITSPLTSGGVFAYINTNTTYTGITITPNANCTLTSPNSAGTNNTIPEGLYYYTSCPYSFGTSYTNSLNCNNIKIPSTSVIIKETINTNANSTYTPYLTVRDCGIYLYNGSSSTFSIFPIYTSIPNFTNFFNQTSGTGSVPVSSGIGGSGGVGNFVNNNPNPQNSDDGFLILPNYGLILYDGTTIVLNYHNSTSTLMYIKGSSIGIGDSCKAYYNQIEITSY